MAAGILQSGLIRLLHSVAWLPSTRTMPISVTRSSLAVMPVVSRSTKATGSGNIEFQPIKETSISLDERTIVRYCIRYVERSFLPSRVAGLLRGSSRAAVVLVHRCAARPAVEILGGGAGGAAQACRLRGIDAGPATGADAALLPASAGWGAGARRATEPHRLAA